MFFSFILLNRREYASSVSRNSPPSPVLSTNLDICLPFLKNPGGNFHHVPHCNHIDFVKSCWYVKYKNGVSSKFSILIPKVFYHVSTLFLRSGTSSFQGNSQKYFWNSAKCSFTHLHRSPYSWPFKYILIQFSFRNLEDFFYRYIFKSLIHIFKRFDKLFNESQF